ncbi:MAG: hypothetical protein HWE20_14330 [Gammaproteobacteria bacterium]|nr:hypothetical protein [Gammaproteobacteria bacterium]
MSDTTDKAQALLDSMPYAGDSQNGALVLTILLSYLIGAVLTYLGYKGKQMWLLTWSVGLMIATTVFGVAFFL